MAAFAGLLVSNAFAGTFGDDKDKKAKKECTKDGKACAGEKKEGCAKDGKASCCKAQHASTEKAADTKTTKK